MKKRTCKRHDCPMWQGALTGMWYCDECEREIDRKLLNLALDDLARLAA